MYAISLLSFLPVAQEAQAVLYCFIAHHIFLTMIDKAKLIIPQFKKTLFSDLNHMHKNKRFTHNYGQSTKSVIQVHVY